MGSGLILLVIVGAWLVVLVPRALRSSDPAVLATKDRFHDAVRVLARRQGVGETVEVEPAEVEPAEVEPAEVTSRRLPRLSRVSRRPRLRRVPTPVALLRRARRPRPRASAATRRTRLMVALLVLCVATLVGAVVGPVWLLAPHLLVDVLLAAVAVLSHRAAVARAARAAAAWHEELTAREESLARAQAVAAAPRRPMHVAGIPVRMPPRPLPLGAPLTLRAVRAAEGALVPRARGAQGGTWSPVPVPPPTYLAAPTAPRRLVDVARPAADSAGAVRRGDACPPEELLDRKRAVNDW